MDEHELEARLAARLHRRFDGGHVSDDLRLRVAAGMREGARPRRAVRWSLGLAAAAALAVMVVGSGLVLRSAVSGPAASGSPAPTPSPTRAFSLVWSVDTSGGVTPAQVLTVMQKRLVALGFEGSAASVVDGRIQVSLAASADASTVEAALGAVGKVEFVPLPKETYGTVESPGPQTAESGQPLPTHEQALFSNEAIANAYVTQDSNGADAVGFTFAPSASAAFASYTANHIGEFFAFVNDGLVISAPYIESAITGGTGIIGGGTNGFTKAEMTALVTTLSSGPLPAQLTLISSNVPSPTPTPTPTPVPAAITLEFEAVGFNGAPVTDAQVQQAADVVRARLTIVVTASTVDVVGRRIVVELAGGANVDAAKATVGATGSFSVVPLPAAAYGTASSPGPQHAVVGQALPTTERPLFGHEAVVTTNVLSGQNGDAAIVVQLTNAAAASLAAYAGSHAGAVYAVLLDGDVIRTRPLDTLPAELGWDNLVFTRPSGGASADWAAGLHALLQSGPLPVALTLVTEDVGPTRAPDVTPPPVSIRNETNIDIRMVVNETEIATVSPGAALDPIRATMPELPWTVEARTASGTVLASLVLLGTGDRATNESVACGRVDLWSGGTYDAEPTLVPDPSKPCDRAGLAE